MKHTAMEDDELGECYYPIDVPYIPIAVPYNGIEMPNAPVAKMVCDTIEFGKVVQRHPKVKEPKAHQRARTQKKLELARANGKSFAARRGCPNKCLHCNKAAHRIKKGGKGAYAVRYGKKSSPIPLIAFKRECLRKIPHCSCSCGQTQFHLTNGLTMTACPSTSTLSITKGQVSSKCTKVDATEWLNMQTLLDYISKLDEADAAAMSNMAVASL
jgi:hypothetical protein